MLHFYKCWSGIWKQLINQIVYVHMYVYIRNNNKFRDDKNDEKMKNTENTRKKE